jgi:hypothetical protein
VLWPLKIVIELELGDVFFFMCSLIAHNVNEIQGVRNICWTFTIEFSIGID